MVVLGCWCLVFGFGAEKAIMLNPQAVIENK